MKRFASSLVVCFLLVLLGPVVAAAQAPPGFDWQWADTGDHLGDHWWAVGNVELWKGDTKFYADKADYYADTHRLIASGHVTVEQADTSISARSIDFNTETDTGIFYGGWGMASMGNRVDRAMFGTLEPDMYFYGETIEKIAKRKYRITRGGFTTCVQPVRRWELTSGSVVIRLEHYAVMKNSILRAKGVPVFYLPMLYFPINKENRATGFLMPTYGSSTAHGFTLNNAFFWAIGRSQDMTVMHDYFSKTGQGIGDEWRYVRGPGRNGSLRFYMLDEHEYTNTDATGTTTTIPAKRSYKIDAVAAEPLNRYLRASASVHYFSNIVSQQTYNMNIADASRSSRTISANLTGSFHGYAFGGAFNRTELFTGVTDSNRTGSEPRFNFSRSEQPIGNLPIYVTFTGEYARVNHGATAASADNPPVTTVTDITRSHVDFSPTVRVPFTRLSFLTINSSVSWHGTWWSKSWDNPTSENILDQSISRRLFEFQSTIVGPVLSRIFTLDNGYAEKMKHTIEPSVTFDYTTAVPQFDRIIQWEALDGIVGGTTRVNYGLANRLFAKRKHAGQVLPSREIFNFGISQSYYTNARASQFDPSYATSFTGSSPNNFSPLALTARGMPTDQLNATFRAEIDSRYKILRSMSANGTYSVGSWLNTSGGWSLTRSIGAGGVINPAGLTQFLNGSANLRLAENKYGGNYSFNYDLARKAFVQQRFTAYYNAQCCGFAIEYQAFNFGNLSGLLVPEDHRLNFSFTLAGIGSFSNVFGALSGAPR